MRRKGGRKWQKETSCSKTSFQLSRSLLSIKHRCPPLNDQSQTVRQRLNTGSALSCQQSTDSLCDPLHDTTWQVHVFKYACLKLRYNCKLNNSTPCLTDVIFLLTLRSSDVPGEGVHGCKWLQTAWLLPASAPSISPSGDVLKARDAACLPKPPEKRFWKCHFPFSLRN